MTPGSRNVGYYLRKEGSRPEDPELAALPDQVKAMVKQQVAQIEGATDIADLQQGLAQMQQMQGQAPPEMKPAFEYLIKKVQERIEQLSSKGDTPGREDKSNSDSEGGS